LASPYLLQKSSNFLSLLLHQKAGKRRKNDRVYLFALFVMKNADKRKIKNDTGDKYEYLKLSSREAIEPVK
jgi:hypothetical protein